MNMKDRLDFLYSIFPGMNLAEILQQYYYQTDFVNYVAQFGFPVDYVGPEYHAFFRDKDLIPNAHARGFKVAPWPVGVEKALEKYRRESQSWTMPAEN